MYEKNAVDSSEAKTVNFVTFFFWRGNRNFALTLLRHTRMRMFYIEVLLGLVASEWLLFLLFIHFLFLLKINIRTSHCKNARFTLQHKHVLLKGSYCNYNWSQHIYLRLRVCVNISLIYFPSLLFGFVHVCVCACGYRRTGSLSFESWFTHCLKVGGLWKPSCTAWLPWHYALYMQTAAQSSDCVLA